MQLDIYYFDNFRHGPSLKPWPNGLASQHKFVKPELANRLTKDGQTDSQVGSQVYASRKSRKFYVYKNELRSNCVNLRSVAKRWKTCVQIWARRKSMQSHTRRWPSGTQVEWNLKTWKFKSWKLDDLIPRRKKLHVLLLFSSKLEDENEVRAAGDPPVVSLYQRTSLQMHQQSPEFRKTKL